MEAGIDGAVCNIQDHLFVIGINNSFDIEFGKHGDMLHVRNHVCFLWRLVAKVLGQLKALCDNNLIVSILRRVLS